MNLRVSMKFAAAHDDCTLDLFFLFVFNLLTSRCILHVVGMLQASVISTWWQVKHRLPKQDLHYLRLMEKLGLNHIYFVFRRRQNNVETLLANLVTQTYSLWICSSYHSSTVKVPGSFFFHIHTPGLYQKVTSPIPNFFLTVQMVSEVC